MKDADVSSIVNESAKEILGEKAPVAQDLSKVVELGKAIDSASLYEPFSNALVDRIYRFEMRTLSTELPVPNVLMDEHEYGNILEVARMKSLPEAEEDPSFHLENGTTYNQDKFYSSNVESKCYQNHKSFQIPLSTPRDQLKTAFTNAGEMNNFISQLASSADSAMQIRVGSMVLDTVDNAIAEVAGDTTGVRWINILKLYNDKFGKSLTSDKCLYDVDFLRYSAFLIKRTFAHVASAQANKIYNKNGALTSTVKADAHLLLQADLQTAQETFLQSSTYHDDLVKINASPISYFQAPGTADDFATDTMIQVNRASDGKLVTANYVVGMIFDRRALGATSSKQKVTSHYNAPGDFDNRWLKWQGNWFNNLDENIVVFAFEDATVAS